MNPQRAARSREAGGVPPQHQADQFSIAGAADRRPPGETRESRWRTSLGWLLLPLTIAFTMQACGWISLLGVSKTIVEDTRARIQADYSPWPIMSFLPVDSSILEQIAEDTGRAITFPEQDPSSESSWGTPTATPVGTTTDEPSSILTPSGTPTAEDASPTATAEGSATATVTSIPSQPATASPPPATTPTPPGNQYFNYTSTPQPPDPTDDGGHGTSTDEQGASNQN